jgi:hypothetical protein
VPLINFNSENHEIKLGKNFVIRKLSPYEKEIIDEQNKKWPTVISGDFILECLITQQAPESRPGEYIQRGMPDIEKAIAILRLYKDGDIGYNFILHPLSTAKRYGFSAAHFRNYQIWSKRNLQPKVYTINGQEKDSFINFFNEYNNGNFEHLNVAIHYFNKSYIEPYILQDSFLDLMISLENLYLKGENQELGYKLRMRMSYILAKELEKRKEISRDIKKAYDYRGKIVHGEMPPRISYEFLIKIKGYVRESLKIFMKNLSLRDNLDEIILEGNC